MTAEAALERLVHDDSDQRAWAVLVHWLWPVAFRAAYRLAKPDSQLTEDITQEALVRFARYAPLAEFETLRQAEAYVATVSRNAAKDLLQRRKRGPRLVLEGLGPMERPDTPRASAGILGPMLEPETLAYVVERLDPGDVEVLDLLLQSKDLGGFSGLLGTTKGAAAVKAYRLRRKVQNVLQDKGLRDL